MSYSRISETGHYIWNDSEYLHFDNIEISNDIINIFLYRLYKLRPKEFKSRLKEGKKLIRRIFK